MVLTDRCTAQFRYFSIFHQLFDINFQLANSLPSSAWRYQWFQTIRRGFGACIPCTCFIFSGILAHCRSELVLSTIGCTCRWCTAVNQAAVTVAVVPLYQDWLFLENILAKTSRRFCDTPTKAGRPRAVSTFSLCRCVKLVQSYSKLRVVQSSYPFFFAPRALMP